MDSNTFLTRLPALAAILQVPWFILLSIARVRLGGTSARPLVKLVDLFIPMPVFAGMILAAVLLWRMQGQGGVWLWSGGLVCTAISMLFLWILVK